MTATLPSSQPRRRKPDAGRSASPGAERSLPIVERPSTRLRLLVVDLLFYASVTVFVSSLVAYCLIE